MKLEGGDPIEEWRAKLTAARLDAAKTITFKDAAEAYIAANLAGWRNPRHAAQWSRRSEPMSTRCLASCRFRQSTPCWS